MTGWRRFAAIAVLAAGTMLVLGSNPVMAQSRAHVYLFRGLGDVFSRGMDSLADEINKSGVYATTHSHNDWKSIAERIAADYKPGKAGPIILIGHSLGADAVMQMADYLGDKGVPVALVVPFDGTQSFPAPGNVARVVNFTQRDYAFMRSGPGFHGSLDNVDLRSDPSIDHLNIDKSPRLHARVISEVLAVVGGRRIAAPAPAKPGSTRAPAEPGADVRATVAPGEANAKTEKPASPPANPVPAAKPVEDAMKATDTLKPAAVLPAVPQREEQEAPKNSAAPVTPPANPIVAPRPASPLQIPD